MCYHKSRNKKTRQSDNEGPRLSCGGGENENGDHTVSYYGQLPKPGGQCPLYQVQGPAVPPIVCDLLPSD